MRRPAPAPQIACVLLLAATAAPVAAQAPLPPLPEGPVRYDPDHLGAEFHREQRERVMEALGPEAVAVILGGVEGGGSIDDLQPFAQDPRLHYLTGSHEPGTALVLVPAGVEVDGARVREILFVPPRDPATEIWLGRRFGPERAQEALGVELAVSYRRFPEIVRPLLSDAGRRAFFLPFPAAVAPRTTLAGQMAVLAEVAQERGGAFDDRTLDQLLTEMREVKADVELELLQRAVDITAEAHLAVLGSLRPGMAEYEIEALIEYTFHRMGSERPGFPSIVASGENSVLLHYDTNRRVTRAGDLVVIDVGASYRGYTADVTRTVPVSGRFSPEQRAIYDLVLEAQEAAIREVRDGASFGAPGEAATRALARGLARLGLLRRGDDVAGLQRFFPHGTSHYLGLQVHDVGSYGALRTGVVITVEPGIYIAPSHDVDARWWNIGVRIEDDVLVGPDGPVVLSAMAPKDPDELERLLAAGRGGG